MVYLQQFYEDGSIYGFRPSHANNGTYPRKKQVAEQSKFAQHATNNILQTTRSSKGQDYSAASNELSRTHHQHRRSRQDHDPTKRQELTYYYSSSEDGESGSSSLTGSFGGSAVAR